MKLFAFTAILGAAQALECWTCNAFNYADCNTNGSSVTCLDNEEVCETEHRKGDGIIESVCIYFQH